MKVKSESEVAQSFLTLSNPMDCSLPGSSVHGILQARVLEWCAIAFSLFPADSTLLSSSLPSSAFFKCQPSSQLRWEFSIAFPLAKGIRKLIFSHLITGHLVPYIFLTSICLFH